MLLVMSGIETNPGPEIEKHEAGIDALQVVLICLRFAVDSIAVSVFVDWLSLSEANPKNNLMMRRAGLPTLLDISGL